MNSPAPIRRKFLTTVQGKDAKIHEAQKPKLMDFRLFLSSFFVLVLLITFMLWGSKALVSILLATLAIGVLFRIGSSSFQSLSWLPKAQSQIVVCLVFASLEILSLAAQGYFNDQTVVNQCSHHAARLHAEVRSSRQTSTGSSLTELDVDFIQCAGQKHTFARSVITFLPEPVQKSTEIEVVGILSGEMGKVQLEKPHITAHQPPATPSQVIQLKDSVRSATLSAISADQTALLLGLAYGDDSSMLADTKGDFKVAGLLHLTAVSGANITLIFMVIYRFGQLFYVRRTPLIMLAWTGTLAYATLVGWEGSVIRAWCMGMVGAIALVMGSGKSALPVFSTAVLFLLLLRPELSLNFGFLLSLFATVALIVIAPALTRLLECVLPKLMAEIIAVPCAASLWTAPLILILSEQFMPYSVFANVLAAPLVVPLTLTGLLALVCFLVHIPAIFELLAHLSTLFSQLLLSLADFISRLPGSAIACPLSPSSFSLTCLSVFIISGMILMLDQKLTHYLLSTTEEFSRV